MLPKQPFTLQNMVTALSVTREMVAKFKLTHRELFGNGAPATNDNRAKVAIKFRDPSTGQTWSGRGFVPKWLRDKNRENYRVAA